MLTRFRHPGARLPLLTAGYVHDKVEWCRGRVMDAYALVYLLSGSGSYRDRQQGERSLTAGDVLVLFPGLEHFYGPQTPGDWAEAYVVFHGPTFVALEREKLLRRERPVLSPGLEPALLGAFDALVRQHSVGPAADGRRTSAALHSLLVELTLADEASRRAPEDRLLLARARLEQQLERELDLPRLCRELGLGYES
ncbi:MAG TPA: AraC family ligand binding domain-containing protein, partial [Polyangiaceae bacterium]|nr:AraC family ligand binding domain-containing protein [Polyangiaceae bacterium]